MVGARRARNGLGPFVVRELTAAGADVRCFLSTRAATRDATREELCSRYGVSARGYLDLDAMLSQEDLDALAILSPAETHRRFLEAALAAGLHTLCEKPFVWGEPALTARAGAVARGFDGKGLVLFENCQWPYTLPFLERLFPERGGGPAARVELWLQPASRGRDLLGDAVPHVLSVVQAVVPGHSARLRDIRFDAPRPEAERLDLHFAYASDRAAADVTVHLASSGARAREPAIALDGYRARRLVSADPYRLSFAADGRSVPLEDPLALLVADFVRVLGLHPPDRRAEASRSGEIAERMQHLEDVVLAFERSCDAKGA